jgi:hypothetical protein
MMQDKIHPSDARDPGGTTSARPVHPVTSVAGAPASGLPREVPMPMPSRAPSTLPSYQDLTDTNVRRRDSRFLAQADLDAWVRDKSATLQGPLLVIVRTNEHFVLRDAVRVLGPRGRGVDVFGMTGRVMALSELIATGATVNATTARLGTVEYDVQLGHLAHRLESVL